MPAAACPLLLDRTLQHQPHPEPPEFADNLERVHVRVLARKQRVDHLLDLHRRQ